MLVTSIFIRTVTPVGLSLVISCLLLPLAVYCQHDHLMAPSLWYHTVEQKLQDTGEDLNMQPFG